MTPQEKELVDELFDRLAKREGMPRDAGAERLIADALRRAPHALYALVQAVLLQDEALKRANARIEELQAQTSGGAQGAPQPQGSFLDSMRDLFGGAREPRGSVPQVRPHDPSQPYQSPGASPPDYPREVPPPGYPAGPAFGTGGSFLGTAASTAAGMIGGALLLDGIRSMFGHHAAAAQPSVFGGLAGDQASPWTHGGSATDSQLARDAGIDHIGDHAHDAGDHPADDDATYETADDDTSDDDDDGDDGDDDDFGGDDGDGPDDSYDA